MHRDLGCQYPGSGERSTALEEVGSRAYLSYPECVRSRGKSQKNSMLRKGRNSPKWKAARWRI